MPDNNFEQYLIGRGYDRELYNYVETSNIVGIKQLDLSNRNIASLIVSANPALVLLYCLSNQLTSLNLKNGNNDNLNGGLPVVLAMNASNNPNLSCIQVDNPVAALGYLWRKDAAATYSADCGYADAIESMVYSKEDALVIYPNPSANHFTVIAIPLAIPPAISLTKFLIRLTARLLDDLSTSAISPAIPPASFEFE